MALILTLIKTDIESFIVPLFKGLKYMFMEAVVKDRDKTFKL